jgi:uncharacterized protein
VKAGAVVKVKVLEVDIPRGRISLTLRLSDDAAPARKEHAPRQNGQRNAGHAPRRQEAASAPAGGAMAAAFARLKR